jgi:hypothetical protein
MRQFFKITMPIPEPMRVDPEVRQALLTALKAIRQAKAETTAGGKNGLYSRLQRMADELKMILGV